MEKSPFPIITRKLTILNHFIHNIPIGILVYLFSYKIVIDKTSASESFFNEDCLFFVWIDSKFERFFYQYLFFTSPQNRMYVLIISNGGRFWLRPTVIHLPLISGLNPFMHLKRESSIER